MGASCCGPNHDHHHDHEEHGHDHDHAHGFGQKHDHSAGQARPVLWIALLLNAGMFVVELGAGLTAGSTSLLADSADFLGDAANYGLALAVLPLALVWRARAALLKGITMGLFGLWVSAMVVRHVMTGTVPEPATMGVVGAAALAVNILCTILLFRFRKGDSNMRAVWICSRNDALGNLAVLLAASGVFATGAAWPDLAVATLMAALALWGAVQVVLHARRDLEQGEQIRVAAQSAD